MAEIFIRKKSKPIWPWLLGSMALLALIVWLVFGNRIQNQVNRVHTDEESKLAAKHLRYIPQVMITKLETYLA